MSPFIGGGQGVGVCVEDRGCGGSGFFPRGWSLNGGRGIAVILMFAWAIELRQFGKNTPTWFLLFTPCFGTPGG